MEGSIERDWAAKHYRVERDSTGLKASKRKIRRIAEDAARHGDPIPDEAHDVVRIYDREGNVVMERDWGQNRQAAVDEEASIVDDLLKLDVMRFRSRYGIITEPPSAAPPDDPDTGAPADGNPEGAAG